MAREVIMPALGMAQETGVIVSWLKRPGEAVRAGEPLFEVETDKAVMAVEADAEGVLAEMLHDEGAEVPVGEVIARIAAEGEVLEESPAAAEPVAAMAAPTTAATSAPGSGAEPVSAAVAKVETKPTETNGARRVLASPKARRLAAERRIDLRGLVRAGAVEPLHVADLDHAQATAANRSTPLGNRIAARAEAKAFLAFRALLAEEGSASTDAALWAAFAAGSLREATGAADPIIVVVERPGGATAVFKDPDEGPLVDVRESMPEAAPALILRDLTGRRMTELTLARDATPALSIAGGETSYKITLTWPGASLTEESAIALVEGLAARIEQPLRHLL